MGATDFVLYFSTQLSCNIGRAQRVLKLISSSGEERYFSQRGEPWLAGNRGTTEPLHPTCPVPISEGLIKSAFFKSSFDFTQ